MTRTELVRALAEKQPQFNITDIELIVKCIVEKMSQALVSGERIEIRGFGCFTLHEYAPRTGRNPKTGKLVALPARRVPHFKTGKPLHDRVNAPHEKPPITD